VGESDFNFFFNKEYLNSLKPGLDSAYSRMRFMFAHFLISFFLAAVVNFSLVYNAHQWIPCTVHEIHKLHFLTTFSLKIGLTIQFTYLKIILLQCFQFSIFNKLSYIQTEPKYKLLIIISPSYSHTQIQEYRE